VIKNYKNIFVFIVLTFLSFNPITAFGCRSPECTKIGENISVEIGSILVSKKGEGGKEINSVLPGGEIVNKGKIVALYRFKERASEISGYNVNELVPEADNSVSFNAKELSDFQNLAEQGYAFIPISDTDNDCIIYDAFLIKTTVKQAKTVANLILKYGINEVEFDLHCKWLSKEKGMWTN
jgi:hypothetical protein